MAHEERQIDFKCTTRLRSCGGREPPYDFEVFPHDGTTVFPGKLVLVYWAHVEVRDLQLWTKTRFFHGLVNFGCIQDCDDDSVDVEAEKGSDRFFVRFTISSGKFCKVQREKKRRRGEKLFVWVPALYDPQMRSMKYVRSCKNNFLSHTKKKQSSFNHVHRRAKNR